MCFSFEGPKKITRAPVGGYNGMVANPPTDYFLRFTIKPLGLVKYYGNILHLTTGENSNRVPWVSFKSLSTTMVVVTGHDADSYANFE